jgi:hypothetical protein
MPIVSDLFASYSDTQGFWIKERSVPTTKNEGEAGSHPLSSSLLNVDIVRELRSAHYSRNKAKNEAKLARARKSKRQGQPRGGNPTQRNKGTKRPGKRQFVARDLAADPGTDYEQDLSDSVFLEHREAVLAPIRTSEGRPISTPISPGLQPPAEKTPKAYTPPDAYTTTTLPESMLGIPAYDVAREFRSYERHRNLTKKNARFTQSRQKKGTRVKPVRGRGSKSVKIGNLQSLVTLAIVDEETASEDEIQTPIEVSLSTVLPDVEYPDVRASPALDMETLITTAKVKYTKGSSKSRLSTPPFRTDYNVEPGFEYVKSVRPVVALDDTHDTQEDDNEPWEHVWNDDLVD